MARLSAFITTFNNSRTLAACLRSVAWADEIVVLDSFSTDDTCDIATQFGCALYQHEFMGYGPQKQLALDKTTHEWVLLLDADEMLSQALVTEIRQLLENEPAADGYEIPRQEQVFWRMATRAVRMNHYLRLFRKSNGHVCDMPIHAAPKVNGRVVRLKASFYHFGETNVHTKVEKINAYSSGLVEHKRRGRTAVNPLVLVFYPPWFFVRSYLFKRGFLNGWAGFIASSVAAFYVFLKYAKLYERYRFEQRVPESMPPDSPPPPAL
jgi:glycosyltransferase involved in cell wall biosynthesis